MDELSPIASPPHVDVAGGMDKAEAITALLRSGLATQLVTDRETALAMLSA